MHPLSSNLLAYFAPFSILHDAFSILVHEFELKPPTLVCAAYNSPVLEPCTGTVWRAGQKRSIQWSLCSDSNTYTSEKQRIDCYAVLAKAGRIIERGDGSFERPIAYGFDMEIGCIEVIVPRVDVGRDYQVVVVGPERDVVFGEFFAIES